ncbi:MAG: hypothetical protein M3358_19785 [Actinomycetota bacterium]|nr:hypothetical protein [Actinomycetota bacterium]
MGGSIWFERAAGDVEGLVEVVGGGLRREIRPEEVHDLLAVEAVIRGEGKQLHEAGGLPEPPLAFPDDPRPCRDLEGAE